MARSRAGWIAGIVVIVLGFGEGYLRLSGTVPPPLPSKNLLLPKNRSYEFKNTKLRGCDPIIRRHTNSLGFRGAEPPAPFDHYLTVLAVGGSSTECIYLSDGHSWPEQLALKLAPDFPTLWLNNAGIDGHSTFGHLILLNNYLAALHPKVVLYLAGGNDIDRTDLNSYETSLMAEENGRIKRLNYWLMLKSRFFATVENLVLAERASLRGIGHGSIDLSTAPMLPLTESELHIKPADEPAVNGYAKRLDELVKATVALGIQPVLITQPALYGLGRDPVTGVDLDRVEVTPGVSGAAAWAKLEAYNDVSRKTARRLNVPLIDLAQKMEHDSNYFYDFKHFSNAGASRAAEIIARDLKPFLKKSSPLNNFTAGTYGLDCRESKHRNGAAP